jgi:hypothetical protein
MNRKQAERFTSPAIGVMAVAMVIAIGFRQDLALPLLAGAELIVGLGCALLVSISLRHRSPAPQSVTLFAVLFLFWTGLAALSVWWFAQGR